MAVWDAAWLPASEGWKAWTYRQSGIALPGGMGAQSSWPSASWGAGVRPASPTATLARSVTPGGLPQVGEVTATVGLLPQPALAAERQTLGIRGSCCDHRTPVHPRNSDAPGEPVGEGNNGRDRGSKQSAPVTRSRCCPAPATGCRVKCEPGAGRFFYWGAVIRTESRNQDLT